MDKLDTTAPFASAVGKRWQAKGHFKLRALVNFPKSDWANRHYLLKRSKIEKNDRTEIMEDMRALRKNLTSELKNSFSTVNSGNNIFLISSIKKQHPYASLTEDKPNAFEVREDFDPVVKIGNPHNK